MSDAAMRAISDPPSPAVDVVTVTANPAIDHTVWVPGFGVGKVNRVTTEQVHAGGKGVNVAAFLAAVGVPVLASGFLGRPNTGLFEEFFEATGIAHFFVSVPTATRTGIKVVDEIGGTTTDLNFPGFTVGDQDLEALEARVGWAVAPGRWLVLAGSLPLGAPTSTYRRLVALAHDRGGPVAVDTSGPALRDALEAGPDLIKPNLAELEELTGRRLDGHDQLTEAARDLLARGVDTVVVSLGADGAVFARNGEVVLATPPAVHVASTVGAGDAMVAGSITGILRGLAPTELARLATAFSAVAISRVGPHLDASAVEETARAVAVKRLA